MHETTLIPLVEKLVKLADDKDVIAKRRLELLRDALEFIDGMSLAEAALRIEIGKELDNA